MRLILKLCIGAVILIPSLVGMFLLGFGGGFFLGLLGVLVSFPLWVLFFVLETIYQVRQDKVELEAAKARVVAEEEEMEAYLLAQMSNRATQAVAMNLKTEEEQMEKTIEMDGFQEFSQEWQEEKQEERMFSSDGLPHSAFIGSDVEGDFFTEPTQERESLEDGAWIGDGLSGGVGFGEGDSNRKED